MSHSQRCMQSSGGCVCVCVCVCVCRVEVNIRGGRGRGRRRGRGGGRGRGRRRGRGGGMWVLQKVGRTVMVIDNEVGISIQCRPPREVRFQGNHGNISREIMQLIKFHLHQDIVTTAKRKLHPWKSTGKKYNTQFTDLHTTACCIE